MRASLAFERALDMASPWLEARNETLERVSKPTAITVRRIIRDNVTTRAKPRFSGQGCGPCDAENPGLGFMKIGGVFGRMGLNGTVSIP
jgi:hypothetical protein